MTRHWRCEQHVTTILCAHRVRGKSGSFWRVDGIHTPCCNNRLGHEREKGNRDSAHRPKDHVLEFLRSTESVSKRALCTLVKHSQPCQPNASHFAACQRMSRNVVMWKNKDKCVLMFWSEVNRPSIQTEHSEWKEERELSSAPHIGRSVRRIEWQLKHLTLAVAARVGLDTVEPWKNMWMTEATLGHSASELSCVTAREMSALSVPMSLPLLSRSFASVRLQMPKSNGGVEFGHPLVFNKAKK